jgi:UDP-N-acetylmuramoyl-L-alanyl-D-glutamate--2,6-diaminopimelate ligase
MMMAGFSPAYIGVTGTNGKTSCAWWLTQLLGDVGQNPGLIGTLGCGVWNKNKGIELRETGYTTPDAKLLQKILAEFAEQGASHVVMEVSSHGLQQGRVSAITFSSALFTNLSHDHLDYHGTMEEYGAAKARLFHFPGLKHAIINLDDDFGRKLISQITKVPVLSYSVANPAADIYVKNIQLDASGLCGELVTPWGQAKLIAPIVGDFNVANLLGVIAVLCAEGFDFTEVVAATKNLQAPPGRLQRVVADAVSNEIDVFVDFAHTPDALDKVLSTLKKQTRHHLWCVFGCGGDRDSSKRAVMGQVVSRLADHGVVTSDNPRSENPQAIIDQIVSGMAQGNSAVIADRKMAILYAVHHAVAGDVVLIAGKGHENYQEIKGNKIPFSDAHEAAMALRERTQSPGAGKQP